MLEQWAAGQIVDGIRVDTGTPLLALACDNDGAQVAAAGIDRLLRIWSLSDEGEWLAEADQMLARHAPKAKQALVVAFDRQGSALLWSLGNNNVIWDPDCDVPQTTFCLHESPVSAAAWSPDGSRLASAGSLADKVVLWDVKDGQRLQELHGDGSGLWSEPWSLDGTRLAVGSTEGRLFICETAEFDQQPDQFWRHQNWIRDLQWFADSRSLISGGGDNLVVLWDRV